eukprot:TRINITY_DN867_c1_g1_i1.p1 TRINITY_DN867_c1_g1~~TRINITY_DN867_c1_g1_i1.p1  ORF type:complete len:303 (+),score=58.63 TRINITY_DN867_c1_g1_i1:51-911(+)
MKVAAATFASLLTSTAGWWCEGHMLVAEIAVLNMEPQLVAQLNNITSYLTNQGFPQSADFTQSACWADDIKKTLSSTESWHFINTPYNPTKVPNVPQARPDNVVNVLGNVQTSLDRRKEYNANLWEISFNLADYVHFVGDSHQPLHCAELFSSQFPPPEGDLGGNKFDVMFNGTSWILHSFWDSVGALYQDSERPMSPTEKAALKQLASDLNTNHTFTPSQISNYNYTQWANDSFNLAIQYAYADLTPNCTLSETYVQNARNVAQSQIALSGKRLAKQLTYLFRDQ